MNRGDNQDAPPTIDATVHDGLRDLMGDDFASLIDAYLEDTALFVQQMQDACARGDMDAMQIPAHSMKSSSANIGAMGLSTLARELEGQIRSGNPVQVEGRVAALAEEFERVSLELSR